MADKASKQSPMVTRIPLTKARANLGAIIKRVHRGKEFFILEKDGLPVAGLMDIDEFEDYLELRDPEVQKIIEESREDYLAGRVRPAEEFFRELEEEEKRDKTSS